MTANPQAGGGLLPCPFCGGEASIRSNRDSGNAWVECYSCMSQSGGFSEPSMPEHILHDHAVREWNRRASTAGEAVAKPGIPTEEEVLGLPDVGGDDEMALAAVPPSIPAGGVREAYAWLGEGDGFRSFTRKKSVADRWCKDGIQVTAVATLSLPAGGVAVSDAMRERLKIARGHLSNIEAHGNAEANAVLVIRNVLSELEAALSPEAKTGER